MATITNENSKYFHPSDALRQGMVGIYDKLAPTVKHNSKDVENGRNFQPFLLVGTRIDVSDIIQMQVNRDSDVVINKKTPLFGPAVLLGSEVYVTFRIKDLQVRTLFEQAREKANELQGLWVICFPFPMGDFTLSRKGKKGAIEYQSFKNDQSFLRIAMYENAKIVQREAGNARVMATTIAALTISTDPAESLLWVAGVGDLMGTGGDGGKLSKLEYQRETIVKASQGRLARLFSGKW